MNELKALCMRVIGMMREADFVYMTPNSDTHSWVKLSLAEIRDKLSAIVSVRDQDKQEDDAMSKFEIGQAYETHKQGTWFVLYVDNKFLWACRMINDMPAGIGYRFDPATGEAYDMISDYNLILPSPPVVVSDAVAEAFNKAFVEHSGGAEPCQRVRDALAAALAKYEQEREQ